MKKLMNIMLLLSALLVCIDTSFAMDTESTKLAGQPHAREDDEIQDGQNGIRDFNGSHPKPCYQPTNAGGVSGAMLAHAFGFAGRIDHLREFAAANTAMVCHSEILNATAPRCARDITPADLRIRLNADSFCFTREITLNYAIDEDLELIAQKCIQIEELNLEHGIEITDQGLAYVAKYSKWLKKLNLSWCLTITAQGIQRIIPQLEYLEELNLCHVEVTNEAIQAIVDGCPRLKKLDLSFCYLRNRTIQSNNLEELNLESAEGVTNETVQAIVDGCPKLKKLNLSNCLELTNPTIQSNTLEELNLSGTHVTGTWVTNETIQAIVDGCPKLKKLNLSSCPLPTNPPIRSDSLEELDLRWTWITNEAIDVIRQNCPNLKKLN